MPPCFYLFLVANLDGMWERTLTIGSAGKLLNATGLRTGWAIGPSHLVKPCQTVLTGAFSSCPTPIQVNYNVHCIWQYWFIRNNTLGLCGLVTYQY